jgi:hypothetical protein
VARPPLAGRESLLELTLQPFGCDVMDGFDRLRRLTDDISVTAACSLLVPMDQTRQSHGLNYRRDGAAGS